MANLSSYNQTHLFGSDVLFSDFLEPKDMCMIIKNEISPLIKDSDFEDMYKDGGRPPISPRILALTLLMQFLEKLSDRAASFNLKFRLDWKIAFGLPLDFQGIHPTTLVYFRDRLIKSEKCSHVFDQIIEHLKSCGLIKKNGKQRIDSTHIIGCVRELSRIELFHETIRLFFSDISDLGLNMGIQQASYERYIDPIATFGITDVQKQEMIQTAGLAMKSLICWVESLPSLKSLNSYRSFTTLKVVFAQNFTDLSHETPPKMIPISTGKGHISSPHDPEAEYANKGKKGWIGYKGQVVETVNEPNSGIQNFITHIEIEEATNYDGDCVASIISELSTKEISPAELYGDTHYNSTDNIEALADISIEMKGSVQAPTREKIEKDLGFKVDLENECVICPMGFESKHFKIFIGEKRMGASFPKEACKNCERRDVCKPEPRGKIYKHNIENKTLAERREKLKDPEYLIDLHHRNGIEGTLSGLVRGQAWRRCRYRGKNKTQLQAKFSGAAANINRLYRQRHHERHNELKTARQAA